MPILFIVSVIFQVICALHAVKTGQDRYWVFLIIIAPVLGCVLYAFGVIIPGFGGSRQGKRAVRSLQKTLNPTRNLQALRDTLSIRDTAQSHTNLADELADLGQFDEALKHYHEALARSNAHHPETMLKMAHIQFQMRNYEQCLQSLKDLLQHNPGYVSQEGHLLQARALHELGRLHEAEQSCKNLIEYYSGPQAKLLYATLLQQQHRFTEARAQLEEIQTYARLAPKFYKQQHKDCLSQVNRLLKELA